MQDKILIIAAHPDDEILGCAGTVAKYVEAGAEAYTLILAEGLTSRDTIRDRSVHEAELSALSEASRRANEIIGVSGVTLADFPDNRLDGVDLLDVVKRIESEIDKHRPSLVFTHFAGDLNVDHQIVSRAVVTACRPVPGQSVKTLLFFEVPSSTEWQIAQEGTGFAPDWFEDIGPTLDKKLSALEAYASEMREWPHARSLKAVEALARWRGATVGYHAAEAFKLGRNIRL